MQTDREPAPQLALATTTVARPRPEECAVARRIAAAMGCPYWPRDELTATCADHHGLLVVERENLALWIAGQRFCYHPNMAKLRVHALRQNRKDALIEALQIAPGASVLDCTCGLGGDAVVAAYVAGPEGRVRALEAAPLLALLVEHGMASYSLADDPDLGLAMRRVEVRRADFATYLREEADAAWDVVYFDPMFDESIAHARGLDLVRCLARSGGPASADLHEARRVARCRVVMKDRRPGRTLARLGFAKIGESRRVCYGVLPAW